MFFKKSFNPTKCKTLLKLTTSRIKLLKNRREGQLKQMKRELAKLLESNQEPSAHIRVELIYRELNIIAAYEIIGLLCELLASRLPILVSQKQCPIDLKEAVASIIYAAPRCSDIPELKKIRSLFTAKYGKEFASIAAELRQDCGVNKVVVEKLSMKGPSVEDKLKLMKEIAIEQGLDWSPKVLESQKLMAPEVLLDGPSRFFSASQISKQESSEEFSSNEPLSPQEESMAAEAKTHVAQNTEIKNGKQFIPFIRPSVEVDSASSGSPNSRTGPMQQQISSSSHSMQSVSTTNLSRGLSPTLSHKYKDDVDSRRSFKRGTSFKGVADAALAAAESAEQAAAAARAVAQLASRTLGRSTEEVMSSDSESSDGDVESQLDERSEEEHLKDPPDDCSTSRMPIFDEPAEERGFRRMDSSAKAPLSYGKSREESTIFRTDRYNFDETKSPLHATISQERLEDDQASGQWQNSSVSVSSNRHYRHNYTRGRSFQSAGAAPSFDTYEWDEHLRAEPADGTPQSQPPTRPSLRPISGAQAHVLTKSTSFVHPKLPDYDNLTAHFQALKAMKSGK